MLEHALCNLYSRVGLLQSRSPPINIVLIIFYYVYNKPELSFLQH